jgi:hypothetical protein
MKEQDFLVLDAFTNEVIACVYVLGPHMMFGVLCKGFSPLISHMDRDGSIGEEVELSGEVTQPHSFLAGVIKGLVLGFGAGKQNSCLFAGFPGDGTIADAICVG